MEKYDVHMVFTPTTPARLTFVERYAVNDRLVNALRTPGKQIVVYGHSGCGKTTLLVNKLQQLYESHITSRCMSGITFDQLVLDAFDQLSPFYTSETSKLTGRTSSVSISQDYLAIKTQISGGNKSENSEKMIRALPPQLTAQALARFMGEAGVCWVLEDFHKTDEQERTKLSQVMKVFMDMADEYRDLKVIAIGAVDTARQVVEYDSEMRNRVAEINVPLMSEGELSQIIEKGAELLNIEIGENLIKGISSYSNGMASVCHHLCLNICTCQGLYETAEEKILIDDKSLNSALQVYLEESSDTLKKAFDTAFRQEKIKKYDNAKLIVKALSELPQEGAVRAEIYEKIKKIEKAYPQGNLTAYLSKLSADNDTGLLRYDTSSGRYSFRDPIYRAFAQAFFAKNSPKRFGKQDSIPYIINDYISSELIKSLSNTIYSTYFITEFEVKGGGGIKK